MKRPKHGWHRHHAVILLTLKSQRLERFVPGPPDPTARRSSRSHRRTKNHDSRMPGALRSLVWVSILGIGRRYVRKHDRRDTEDAHAHGHARRLSSMSRPSVHCPSRCRFSRCVTVVVASCWILTAAASEPQNLKPRYARRRGGLQAQRLQGCFDHEGTDHEEVHRVEPLRDVVLAWCPIPSNWYSPPEVLGATAEGAGFML